MKNVIACMAFCVLCSVSFGQSVDQDEYDENYEFSETKSVSVSGGFGLGLDYGGIGIKLTFAPVSNVTIFGAIGYNFNGAGYNGGLIFRTLPDKIVCPYITAMYGYNAVIVVEGFDRADKTYYGPSFGAGIELKMRKGNFWNFGLLIPVRSKEFHDDFDALDNNQNIDITEPFPVQISVGYHFAL